MSNDDWQYSFLNNYGTYIVYLAFFIGLLLNGGVAISCFMDSQWMLGIWAIFSIILLPKAILGIVLVLGWEDVVSMNISFIIRSMFPGTMRKYGIDILSFNFPYTVLKGLSKQTIWLIISITPIVVRLSQGH